MTTYLIVIGKTSLALVLFYTFYRFILAKDKLFKRNRFYLSGVVLLSFILPWINIPILEPSSSRLLSFAYIEDGNSIASQKASQSTSLFPGYKYYFLFI